MGIMELVDSRTHPHAGGLSHDGGAAIWGIIHGVKYDDNSIPR